MKKIPLVIYTDIGDDIDDSLALTYLVGCENIEIIAIVCDHKDLKYSRGEAEYLLSLFGKKLPIFVRGATDGLFEIIQQYEHISVLSLGPTTQLHADLQASPNFLQKIQRIYFQGQVVIHENAISPDSRAYNFIQDMQAISQILSYDVPMTFIGKFAAYECPLYQEDILSLAQNYPGVGAYLTNEASKRRQRLQELNTEMFEKLYGTNDAIVSFPYDLLAAMTITHPELFNIESIGTIQLIGERDTRQGIKDVAQIKALMR
ncbi:MAG: nucleoside hydrolase [Candidatus Absconditabacteria bacterium]